jgi:hypothetical protein
MDRCNVERSDKVFGAANIGIPTVYKGVRYRSRLEARWAAFFDLVGWEAHYEPFDLNGWIPDFVINGRKQRVAVDVRPVSGVDDPVFLALAKKMEQSGWTDDLMIVSYFWPSPRYWDGHGGVGWLNEYFEYSPEPAGHSDWGVALFQVTDDPKIIAGFCHETNDYRDRITGYHPGGQVGVRAGVYEDLKSLWAQAANEVQWCRAC